MKKCVFQICLGMSILFMHSCTKDQIIDSSVKSNHIDFKWTAYKYTERFAVSGSFDDIAIEANNDKDASLLEDIENITMTIDANKVSTTSNLKRSNLINYFFSKLSNSQISGRVAGKIGDEATGVIQVALAFNDVTREVNFDYIAENNRLNLLTNIDLNDWKAMNALDELKTCCETYHTGSDGVHRVWPKVDIEISMDLYRW